MSLQGLGSGLALSGGRLASVAVGISLGLGTQVTGIDVGLLALTGAVSGLDELLVRLQDSTELVDGDVVEEDAFAELAVWDGKSLLAISGFPGSHQRKLEVDSSELGHSLDSLGSNADELVVKRLVVHGQTNGRDQTEPLVSLGIVEDASGVSQGDRVGHVDGDGMTVSQGYSWGQLEGWRPGVTESDHSVETQLVQVGRFELRNSVSLIRFRAEDRTHLEHDLNTLVADLLTRSSDVLTALLVTEAGLDQLLAVLDEEVPNALLSN